MIYFKKHIIKQKVKVIEMEDNNEITNLTKENDILKKELEQQKFNYKKLSTELGQSIFECEDLEKENRKLKQEIETLKEEISQLKKFKEEVESSTSWKVKSIFK